MSLNQEKKMLKRDNGSNFFHPLKELASRRKCLPKLPIRRNDIKKRHSFAINQGDLERELLRPQIDAALPIGAPVAVHGHPRTHPRALDPCSLHVAAPADVGDHDHVEIALPSQGESDPTSSFACHPFE